MNLEKIRERLPRLNGKHHNHDGLRSLQRKLDASKQQLIDYEKIPEDQEIILFQQTKK